MSWPETDAEADARYRALEGAPPGAASVSQLLAALRDPSWRVRRLATDRLATLEPSIELVRELVALLGQRDETAARNAAAGVLAQLGVSALPAVVVLLQHEDPDQRKFAAEILGELRRTEGVVPLVAALEDADANVRTAAAEALGRVGGADARRALERLLGSADVMLRVCALEGLARLGLPAALPTLVPLLADPLTRRSAWRLLAHVDHPTAAHLLVRALASRDARDAALVALGARGLPLAPDVEADLRIALRQVKDTGNWLQAGLESGDDERRRGALVVARALGAPHLALAMAASVRAGRDGPLALDALVRLGPDGGRALLSSMEALADLSGEARAVATDAILALAEPSHVELLVLLVDSGDGELAELGARALGRTRSRDAIAPLVRLFDDDALAVHAYRSLVALARTWPEEVRAALHPLVAGRVRPHVVRAWAEVVGARAHELLKRAMNDSHDAVRAAVAESCVFSQKDTGPVLRAAMMDEAALVRRAATRALGRLSLADAQPLLLRALNDVDPTVLALACTAAAELASHDAEERVRELCLHADAAVALAALDALALLGRVGDEVLLRAASHADPDVLKLALALGADRPLLFDKALAALSHPRWDVRSAAARMLAVAAGRDALGALQDAEAREADPVTREALSAAAAALSKRV